MDPKALFLSLILTALAYSIFPMLFALIRKKPITKKKYFIISYAANFIVFLLFSVLSSLYLNVQSSGAPYMIWTCISAFLGTRLLRSLGTLAETDMEEEQSEQNESMSETVLNEQYERKEISIDTCEDDSASATEKTEIISESVSVAENVPREARNNRSHSLLPSVLCVILSGALIIVTILYIDSSAKLNKTLNVNEYLNGELAYHEYLESLKEVQPDSLELSFKVNSFDPCGFMYDNYAFDKTPNDYIAGMKKGIDYSVSDFLYDGMGVYTYLIYPEFEYMCLESGKTYIGLVAENEETDIDSVIYFFDFNKNNAARFLNLLYKDISKTCGDYVLCTRTYESSGRKYDLFGRELNDNDPKIVEANIDFEKFVYHIANSNEGAYCMQWNTKGYTVMLNVNVESNVTAFSGTLLIIAE